MFGESRRGFLMFELADEIKDVGDPMRASALLGEDYSKPGLVGASWVHQ